MDNWDIEDAINKLQNDIKDLKNQKEIKIGKWILKDNNNKLEISIEDKMILRLSDEQDKIQIFKNNNGLVPYFYFNKQGRYGFYDENFISVLIENKWKWCGNSEFILEFKKDGKVYRNNDEKGVWKHTYNNFIFKYEAFIWNLLEVNDNQITFLNYNDLSEGYIIN